MAMRPRTSGITTAGRPAIRPVYEDFRPLSEWKQEQGSDILLVYLPGFMREQIKVTSEPSNIIKARGERLLVNNTWSRFNQDYRIPENCNVRGIRAKFEGGILSITMPKKIVPPQLPTQQAAKTTQQPPSTPKTTTSLEAPEPKPQKSPEDKKTTVGTPSTQVTEKDWSKFQEEKRAKSPSPEKVTNEPKPQKITEEDRRTTVDTQTPPKFEAKTREEKNVKSQSPKKESTERVEDRKTIVDTPSVPKAERNQPKSQKGQADAMKPEKSGRETLEKEKKMDKKNNEDSTPAAESSIKKFLDKREKKSDEEVSGGHGKDKAKEHNLDAEKTTGSTSTSGAGGDQLENFQKSLKDLTMKIREDRESLVNVGVAVLVIVTLGIYMCYN